MQKEPDDFGELRKLLAIKKYESPPPGYFNRFSDQVIARIEARQISAAVPSWRHWLAGLWHRPAVSGAYALLFGCLAMIALGLSQTQIAQQNLPQTAAWDAPGAVEAVVMLEPAAQPVAHAAILPSSISPVVGSVDSPFQHYGLRVDRASFQPR
jgi:hypothetical protein